MVIFRIFGYIVLALCVGAIVYIFIDRLRGKTPIRKVISTLSAIGAFAAYAYGIWMIRTNDTLVAYREKYGCKHILLGSFGLFILTYIILGILNPLEAKQGSKKAKAGQVITSIMFYLRIILLAVVPIILALEIR